MVSRLNSSLLLMINLLTILSPLVVYMIARPYKPYRSTCRRAVNFSDSGYTDYEQEDLYVECEQIFPKIHCKENSLRPDPAWDVFLKKTFRKPVENVFSRITNLFPRKIHAVIAEGFLLKLFLFLSAFAINGCLAE